MTESGVALITAIVAVISILLSAYTAYTTAKNKKAEIKADKKKKQAEIDDIYSQINKRNMEQYEALLKAKDHASENLELRISSLEQDRQVNKGQIKFLLKYIGYLLEEIRNDKSGSFKPVTMDAYRLACEAGL